MLTLHFMEMQERFRVQGLRSRVLGLGSRVSEGLGFWGLRAIFGQGG